MFGRKAKRIRELESELLEKSIELEDTKHICQYFKDRLEDANTRCKELSDKHWNECWQISAYDLEAKELKEGIVLRDKIIVDLILQSPESAAGLLEKCTDEYTKLGKILSEYLNN